MKNRIRDKWIPILGGAIILATIIILFRLQPPLVRKVLFYLDNQLYDVTIRYFHRPLKKDTPITVVDIDDESIAREGRWPWSRKKMAKLINILQEQKALVVGLDVIFGEKEENLISQIEKELKKENISPPLLDELDQKRPLFAYDQMFASSLQKIDSILGFVLHNYPTSSGLLPKPILTLTDEEKKLLIPKFSGYLASIPVLQRSAKGGGFINASLDRDGIIRSSYLVLRHQDALYPSLALSAVSSYLLEDKIELIVHQYGKVPVLEGIRFGNITIPTDPWGRVLIPFRGLPYSFPYLSASDVLQKKADKNLLANRLIFIGSSAAGKDLFSTAISPVYPGVEIHASIAAGILDKYFPSRPAWGEGVSFFLIIVLGSISVFLFPFLGAIFSTVLFILMVVGLIFLEVWIWKKDALFFSVIAPLITIFLIYLFQEIYGYFFESRKKKEIKDIFGQYVPSEHINRMLRKGKTIDLQGENKELTVLFSDIRGFTSISEKLSAPEIKNLLNEYLTPMTEVIFEHNGTIDKYVGDMIMAFWGAPLPDDNHPKDAIEAGLSMQRKLDELNKIFQEKKQLTIEIGVGINTGMMNVGDMGSRFRRAYTVLGDSVNLASRLESLTKLYHVKIIVSAATKERTTEHFVFRTLDTVKVKGKKDATEIFEVVCKKEEMTPTLQEELDQFHKALQSYREKKWDEAEKTFQDLMGKYPHRKGLLELYLSRIEDMRKNPPGEDWQGVYILGSK